MRMFNLCVMIFGGIVLAALGVLSLVAAVYPPVLLSLGDVISGPTTYAVEGTWGRALALLMGLLFILLVIYFIWGNRQAIRRERTVVLQNPLGEVLVSLPAIEDFDRVLKGKIEGLRDIKGRVVDTRRGLKVTARITVYSEYSIAEVTQKVQDAIRNYVQNTLGIEQDINPVVVVTKVVSRERLEAHGGLKTTSSREMPPR